MRSFLDGGGFGAFTTNFEDLGGLRQLPGLAVQRLMADGYGFGAEGDWKTAILVRAAKVMGAGPARRHLPDGGLHLRPRPRPELILGAHMLEVCPSLTTERPVGWRSTRWPSAAARTRSGSCSPPTPAPASWSA
jgi:L-arabinose isomerase